MKYIRTKDYDLILQVSDKITDEYGAYYLYDNDTKWFENRIIKVADTIEELCDAFYFVEDEDNCPHPVNRLDDFLDKDKKLTECPLEIGGWITWLKDYPKKGKIKGAIWTAKGIIYVADMDEEGNFKLL